MNIVLLLLAFFTAPSDNCDLFGCVAGGIPFGTPKEIVMLKMKQLSESSNIVTEVASNSVHYDKFMYWRHEETTDFSFRFNSNDELDMVNAYLQPQEYSSYPQLFNLYMQVRDEIVESCRYDSVEFIYKFRDPYGNGTEAEALAGTFTFSEMAALRQDANQKTSKYRYAKVWSIFKSKEHPEISLKVMIAYVQYSNVQDDGAYCVYVEYEDTVRSKFRKSGH